VCGSHCDHRGRDRSRSVAARVSQHCSPLKALEVLSQHFISKTRPTHNVYPPAPERNRTLDPTSCRRGRACPTPARPRPIQPGDGKPSPYIACRHRGIGGGRLTGCPQKCGGPDSPERQGSFPEVCPGRALQSLGSRPCRSPHPEPMKCHSERSEESRSGSSGSLNKGQGEIPRGVYPEHPERDPSLRSG